MKKKRFFERKFPPKNLVDELEAMGSREKHYDRRQYDGYDHELENL